MISNKKTLGILFFILSYTSLIISFFFNEDGSGGGSKGDFEVTYGFIIALQNNLLADPVNWTLVHTPLHFLILSFVTRLIEDPYLLRFLFCIFSAVLPIIFFLLTLIETEEACLLVLNIEISLIAIDFFI